MRHREFTEIKKIIGKNIQLLRKQHQLTQEQISDRLNLSTSAYCKIEYGETDLTIPRLFLLAGIYCMSPVALLATICEGVTLVVPDGR